jgi:curved DNA-binding protein CbpA
MTQKSGFVDYYEVLQISPNAMPETVHRVYRILAQLYHPDNTDTGDVEMFGLILEAYRALNDPEKRAAYDVEHKMVSGLKWKIFDQPSAMQGIDGERRKRIGILSLLCTKRINDASNPALTLFELEDLLGCPREHLELSLWYLRESGRISRGDNGRYVMTAKGFEMLEESQASISGKLRMLNPAFSDQHATAASN